MPLFKSLIFIIFISSMLFGSQQLVVVIAQDMNATSGMMTRYEKETGEYKAVYMSVPVILGRNGLGWDKDREPLKREGDGRSPAGLFDITSTFGADPTANSALPYWHADEYLICIDDVNDTRYNTMGYLNPGNPPKSFEQMRRNDEVYRNGAVINYNGERISGRGSCIFFHLNHPDKRPTAGCTAMEEEPLLQLIRWFDPDKKPKLLQIPRSECEQYEKEFTGIKCE